MAANGSGTSQAWLAGAPITKLLSIATVLAYVGVESANAHDWVVFDTNKIIYDGELHRLLSGHFTFATAGELVLGMITLSALLRRFEREMGSRKFFMFLMAEQIFSTIFTIIIAQLFFDNGLRFCGPYQNLGAMLFLFHRFTPRLHPMFFGILGFHFSEKSVQYAFAIQAAAYRGWETLVPTACGALAGSLCVMAPFNAFDLPNWLVNAVAAIGIRFLDSPPGILAPRAERGARFRAGPPTDMFQAPPPPPDAAIEQLLSMGFEREAVLRALRQSHNNVERAADRLLSGT